MICNGIAKDNLGFIIDYNATTSLCSIRKIRLLNCITNDVDQKNPLESPFFSFRLFYQTLSDSCTIMILKVDDFIRVDILVFFLGGIYFIIKRLFDPSKLLYFPL